MGINVHGHYTVLFQRFSKNEDRLPGYALIAAVGRCDTVHDPAISTKVEYDVLMATGQDFKTGDDVVHVLGDSKIRSYKCVSERDRGVRATTCVEWSGQFST